MLISLRVPWIAIIAVTGGAVRAGDALPDQFRPSRLTTATGEKLPQDWGSPAQDCGECHPVQFKEWDGSLHSRAHVDPLYRVFADRAREEGGEPLYRFCSGCHAPAAVASGEIPGDKSQKPTFHTDEGVSCVVCHAVQRFNTVHAGGGANGSIVLEAGDVMYGPIADPAGATAHESAASALHSKSEFCSTCHTLLHPTNGTVIENTFEEWKHGPFAAAGIQCQDCHMRTVDQALEVASKMKPAAPVPGRTTDGPELRPDVHAHTFIGASVNVEANRSGEAHSREAERRLKTAAGIALGLPLQAEPGTVAAIEVAVTNESAGHAIPTSITELRQVWVDLRVTDAAGGEVYRSGATDETGRVDPKAVMYHSVLLDEGGKVTYLPWRAVKISYEKLIPPKRTVRERYEVPVPAGAQGPLRVRAVLRYRSAPQDVLDELFGKGKLVVRPVDMASAEGTLALGTGDRPTEKRP